MPSQKVRVIVEFPAGMRKLNKKEADRLQSLFRTELANVMGAVALESVAHLEFDNVTSPPISGGKFAANEASSKKGVTKGGAKKSSKKG